MNVHPKSLFRHLLPALEPKNGRLLGLFLIIFSALSGHADNTSSGEPLPYKQHLLHNAIQVQFTDGGIKAFQDNVIGILRDQGIDIHRGFFNNLKFESKNEITLKEMETNSPETAKMFKAAQDALNAWLVDFKLNNPKPGVQVSDAGYVVDIKKLSLNPDPKLLATLNKKDGAVLVLDLEVTEFFSAANDLLIYDLNNSYLGKVGFKRFTLRMTPPSPSMKIRIPLYFRINEQNQLEFEALTIQSNLNKTKIEARYEGLIHPEISVQINNKKFSLNTDKLNQELRLEIPKMIDKAKTELHQYIQEKLPKFLNEAAKKSLLVSLEQVNYMEPPGAPINDTREQFRWGLKSEKVWMNQSLHWELGVFVEDTLNNKSLPTPDDRSPVPAQLESVIPETQYDLGIAIDRGFINRILQLSFERQLFANLESCDGSGVSILTRAPKLKGLTPNQRMTSPDAYTSFASLHVQAQQDSEGWQNAILKSPYNVDMDLILRLEYIPTTNEIEIHADHFDPNSFNIDPRYLRLDTNFIRAKILKAGRTQLAERSRSWQNREFCPDNRTRSSFLGAIAVPTPMGMNASVRTLHVDSQGNVLVYLKLGGSTL